MAMTNATDYERLYNLDQHLREVADKKRPDTHIERAILNAFPEEGPHLLDKLAGYNYQLSLWLLHLSPANQAIFWAHPDFNF